MDILTAENFSSINIDLIYLPDHPVREGIGGKGAIGGIVISTSCNYYFISIQENLMQHPSNNISIVSPQLIGLYIFI